MALTETAVRQFEVGDRNDLPVAASAKIFSGAYVGDNASGFARPLVAGDPFFGIAERLADNSAGAAGAIRCRVIERGKVVADVTGATGAGDVGSSVYASADDTLTLTALANTLVGKVARYVSGTTCVVSFNAAQVA